MIEPILGPLRVSSTAATAASYWRPALADGSALLGAMARSAPGRTFVLLAGASPSNQPQPPSAVNGARPSQR